MQTGWKTIKSQIRCCWKNQLVGYLINFMVMFRRWTSTNIKWIFTFKNNDKKSKWTFLWFKERTICSSVENFLKLCTVYWFQRIKYIHQNKPAFYLLKRCFDIEYRHHQIVVIVQRRPNANAYLARLFERNWHTRLLFSRIFTYYFPFSVELLQRQFLFSTPPETAEWTNF